jgi:alpha-soluble NSF attachment protein
MSKEKQARDLCDQADKKIASKLSSLMGLLGNNKYDDAADLYKKAANLYKVEKMWKEAGETFLRVAECAAKGESKLMAGSSYVDAANCYRQVKDFDRVVLSLQESANLHVKSGKYENAAKVQRDIADVLEKELKKMTEAAEAYRIAGEFFEQINSKSTATSCYARQSECLYRGKAYEDAILVFFKAAERSIDDKLLTFSVKDYLYKASLCKVAQIKKYESPDAFLNDVRGILDKGKDLDAKFSETRECRLVEDLLACYDADEFTKFDKTLKDYDKISRLDPEETLIYGLLKEALKKKLQDVDVQ